METVVDNLPRPEITDADRLHETRVRLLNSQFPTLDPLMCSVLLNCPTDLMEKLKADPLMWITPKASSVVISNAVTVTNE